MTIPGLKKRLLAPLDITAERYATMHVARNKILKAMRAAFSDAEARAILDSALSLMAREDDEAALWAVRDCATFTARMLAERLDIKPTAACNRLARLHEIGLIVRHGKSGRDIVWKRK